MFSPDYTAGQQLSTVVVGSVESSGANPLEPAKSRWYCAPMPRFMRRCTVMAFAMALVLLQLASLAAAELPGVGSEYLIEVWQSDDGLPQNSVISMAQTTDGYLWMSTFGGIARFDGRRFDVYDDDAIPQVSRRTFSTLRADATGNLWMRSDDNVIVEGRNGHFRTLGEADGLPPNGATVLEVDSKGAVWIGDGKGRLLNYLRGRFTVVNDQPPTPDWGRLFSLLIDTAGNFWTCSDHALARMAGGKWSIVREGKGLGPMRLLRDGSIVFVSDGNRLCQYANGKIVELGEISGGFYGYFIADDPDGNLWMSSRTGALRRDPAGRWTGLTRAEGFPADTVRSELVDREGNHWFGTDGGGLIRLKHRTVQAFGAAEGMNKKVALSVAADGTNGAWVAILRGGLSHFDGARFSQILSPPWLDSQSLAWCVTPARQGGIWIGSYGDGLFRVNADGTGLRRYDSGSCPGMSSGPIQALFEARNGDLWFGAQGGLSRFSNGRFQTWAATNGLAEDQVTSIAGDDTGAIWVGTSSGLNRITPNAVTNLTSAAGLDGQPVRSIFCDSHGEVWIGGRDLTRFKAGRFSAIRSANGLPVNVIKGIIEDDLGCLWLATPHGILRASLHQLDDFCDTGQVLPQFLDITKADGLPSNECSGSQPAVSKGTDGRLWFATLNGLAVIDPAHLSRNSLPPAVAIESILADGKPLAMPDAPEDPGSTLAAVEVPPGISRLEIRMAALSFTAPEKNRFRYFLRGLDSKWVAGGTSDLATYTRLPPGKYSFQVRACNNDGVWNESGATLPLSVLPFFWQTASFHVLVAAAVCGLAYGFYRHRLAQAERRRLVQEAFARQVIETQEAERKRIARELHDGVGQNLLLVKNRIAAGLGKAEPSSPIIEDLGLASAEVSQAIEEVRSTARALRPVELDRLGLGKALESMLDRIGRGTTTRISHELDELGQARDREAEIQLYRIAQEAINNVIKHSKAREVIVELKREADTLRLTVQDDGVGFDPAAAERMTGSGLSGMAERARLIGGVLSVKSVPGKGCRLSVTVALSQHGRG
jgi:signal transduction histidine kinase/ligand-binding sensor domain-containing protein